MFSNLFLLHLNIFTWEGLVRFDYSVWIMWFIPSYANMQWQSSTICLPQSSHSQWTIQTRNTYIFKGKCTNTCILNKLKECKLQGKWSFTFIYPILFLISRFWPHFSWHYFTLVHLHQNNTCPVQLQWDRRPVTPMQNYASLFVSPIHVCSSPVFFLTHLKNYRAQIHFACKIK